MSKITLNSARLLHIKKISKGTGLDILVLGVIIKINRVEMKKKEKILIAIISGWFFIHLTIYITTKIDPCGYSYSLSSFWPIDSGVISCIYDLSEFLVYAITPILIYATYKILNRIK